MKKQLVSLMFAALVTALPAMASATPVAGVDYASIVEHNRAAVVFVSVTQKPASDKEDDEAVGQGSGFVIDAAKGYILTNAHVVKGAKEVHVTLDDKRRFKAKVIGADERTDVAVIQIQAAGLQAVKIGSPTALRVGEPVAAVGAPYGLEMTVTAGIVSAKHRNLGGQLVPFLQTDAAVNPGNSGGPLFNAKGEVVGINSQIYSRTGSFAGLSFAIPVDIASDVAKELITHGAITRGKIGIVLQPVSDDLAEAYGLPKEEGAMVTLVDDTGPAAKAGVQVGDIILKVDDTVIEDSVDLPRYVTGVAPGSSVRLEVWRNHAKVTLTSKVVSLEETGKKAEEPKASPIEEKLGVKARPLNPGELQKLDVKFGLMLENVREKSLAAKAGLKTGDVLMAERGHQLRTVEDLQGALATEKSKAPLLVLRENNRAYILVSTETNTKKE